MTVYFLVLDAGTGAGRAVVLDQHGEVISCAYREWSYQQVPDVPGGVYFVPQEFEDVLIRSAAQAISASGIEPEDIVAVVATSLREGIVFIDREGREIYAGPNFDERAVEEGEFLAKDYGEQLYFTSGTYPPAYGYAARLRWFEAHRPQEFARIYKILTLGDWITWKLCGELICEPSLASASGIFDVSSRDWSLELVELMGIERSLLPPVYMAGEQVGMLRCDMAKRMGLPSNIAVVAGGGDTQCSILGMGLAKKSQTGCVAGTTSPVQQLSNRPIFDRSMRTWTNCYLLPDVWCLESNAIVTGLAFRWLRDFLDQGTDYESVNALIETTPIGSQGALAFLGAEIMDMSRYRSVWTGGLLFPVPPEKISMGDLARAVVESNAYAVRGNIEQIMQISSMPVLELHICGGQTASRAGMQILADVLGNHLHIHDQRSASRGAAMCAAVGMGVYSNIREASERMVPDPRTLEPIKENVQRYQPQYDRWRTHYLKVRKL